MQNIPYALIRLWSGGRGTMVGHLAVCPHAAAFISCDDDTLLDATELIADEQRVHDAIVAATRESLPMPLEDGQNELRLLYEESAPAARFGEVAAVNSIQVAASRFAAPRLLSRLVPWRADELVPTWSGVTEAIGVIARDLGAQHNVVVRNAEGRRGDNHLPIFVVQTARATDALTLTLHPAQKRVRCFAELANGAGWECGYRVDGDGSWLGPLAPQTESRRTAGADAIAREVVQNWLVALAANR